jgi:hypothetical protein
MLIYRALTRGRPLPIGRSGPVLPRQPGRPPAKADAKGDSAMPAAPDTPRGRQVLSKDRMEGFSDGVFGFAATLP